MKTTLETAAFATAATMAYGSMPVPSMLIATTAALSQRTVSAFVNALKNNSNFKKCFDSCVAIGLGAALAKPLTTAVAQDLSKQSGSIEETPPIHPGVFVAVGTATSGTFFNAFDFLSPAKVLTKVAQFPSEKIPLGSYLISLGVTIKAVDLIMKNVQPLINQDPATCQIDATDPSCHYHNITQALLCAAAAGTITGIVLTDLLSPSENSNKKKN